MKVQANPPAPSAETLLRLPAVVARVGLKKSAIYESTPSRLTIVRRVVLRYRPGRQAQAPEWLCSRLDVEALTRDQDGGGWGYLLAFADPLGHVKTWAMPARMLRLTAASTGPRC
jgi:hypothetical protein